MLFCLECLCVAAFFPFALVVYFACCRPTLFVAAIAGHRHPP